MSRMNRALAATVIAGALLPGALPGASEPGTAAAMVDAYYSQFQQPGYFVDDLMTFYADDVLFTDPTFEIVARGKEAVRRLYSDLGTSETAYEDIRWTITGVIAADDSIVIRGAWSGRFHGCDFDIDFMTLWRLRDGKIAEQNDFFAASAFDQQVGWDGKTANCDR